MGYLYWQLLYQRQIMREDYVASYGIVPLPYTQRSDDIKRPEVLVNSIFVLIIVFMQKLY